MSVLEASNQISLLVPYFSNIGKRLVKSPKLYFNDVGLLCFLLGLNEASVTGSHLIGAIWETLCCAELRKYLRAQAPEATHRFYRDQAREVDFVVERAGMLTLADAKWTELPTQRDFEQMSAVMPALRHVLPTRFVLSRTRLSHPVGAQQQATNITEFRNWL